MNQTDFDAVWLSPNAQAHLDRSHAEARRDVGISNAIRRADRTIDGWGASARAALLVFLEKYGHEPFLAENARTWAESKGVVATPPDGRAWGAVMRAAKRAGIVKACGFAPANSSNRSPKVLWSAP